MNGPLVLRKKCSLASKNLQQKLRPLFNLYEWGGYLECKLPERKTFIDSRTDIFEYRGILRDYVAISTFIRSQELLDVHHIGYILYPSNTPLAYFLSRSPDRECVFRDDQASIYRRVNRQHN